MRVSIVLFSLMGFAVGMLTDSYITTLGVIMLLCVAIAILWIIEAYHADCSKKAILLQYVSRMDELLEEARKSDMEQRVQLFKEISTQAEAMKLFLQSRGG